MSIPQPRPPIKAQTKVSPLIELSEGSLYPYWDVNKSGINPYLNAIRRAFASINPFSHQQVPTSERMAVGVRNGSEYYKEGVYPHGVHFDSWFPSHYDPHATPEFKSNRAIMHGVRPGETLANTFQSLGPRFCTRTIKLYKQCLIANDDRKDVCKQQEDNIMSICPSFSLDEMKEKKMLLSKVQALSNQKYHRVMKVPEYNRGRSVADVPHKSWSDGQRQNLRPSTLWADDRYADVTAEQVEAAKARIKKRRQIQGAKIADLPKYDRTYEAPPTEIPLYSV